MNRDAIFLRHILDPIEKVERSTRRVGREKFGSDVDLQDATLRRIEIIGEAVKNISEKTKKNHPEVEWKKIAGTRDMLIHAYFSIDPEVVYGILEKDIPKLKGQMLSIIAEVESENVQGGDPR